MLAMPENIWGYFFKEFSYEKKKYNVNKTLFTISYFLDRKYE